MKKIFLSLGLSLFALVARAQSTDSTNAQTRSSYEKMQTTESKLSLGGYGEVHYNQPLNSEIRNNGELDVHRMVMLLGYNFNSRTRFVSEIEFEHVSEVFVEQAYIQYKINKYVQFRGGLLLIPMGIINETHEPTTFNGVERPIIDQKLSPTTWREVGFGFAGLILPVKMKYQVYLVNGFNGYDGKARLNGKDALRNGRQKGAESYISSSNYSVKTEFFGFRGLNIGLSGYFGETQSSLYDGIDKKDAAALSKADSSVVGVSILGLDAIYTLRGFQGKGQLYYTSISNTEQYNAFTAVNGVNNNLGSSMSGYYIEGGYNLFHFSSQLKSELVPFLRFEGYDTHQTVSGGLIKNDSYKMTIITTGISLKLSPGAVIKTDMQFLKPASSKEYTKVFNAGIAVMF